jgi:hypothetical protein
MLNSFTVRISVSIGPIPGKQLINFGTEKSGLKTYSETQQGQTLNRLCCGENAVWNPRHAPRKHVHFIGSIGCPVCGIPPDQFHALRTQNPLSNERDFVGHVAGFKTRFVDNEDDSEFALAGFRSNFLSLIFWYQYWLIL